jgi:hypothetical protein
MNNAGLDLSRSQHCANHTAVYHGAVYAAPGLDDLRAQRNSQLRVERAA